MEDLLKELEIKLSELKEGKFFLTESEQDTLFGQTDMLQDIIDIVKSKIK